MTRAQSGRRTTAPAEIFLHDSRPSLPPDFRQYGETAGVVRLRFRQPPSSPMSRQESLAWLCQRVTRESFAPLTVLIDRHFDCQHYSGPTERYLHVPEGAPTHNLLAMLRQDLRAELETALQQAWQQNRRMTVDGGTSLRQGTSVPLRIHLLPVLHDAEELMLVCFVEELDPDLSLVSVLLPVIEIREETLLELPDTTLLPIKSLLLRPAAARPVIFVVDRDDRARHAIRALLEREGHLVEDFASCEAFLAALRPGQAACLLIDPALPGMTGFDLLRHLEETGRQLPTVMITGAGDVPMAVQAMKAGVSDFIDKPMAEIRLLASIRHAVEKSHSDTKLSAGRDDAASRIAGLTPRQHQIMGMVLAGHPNKNIAADLDISQRTVEHHRASIMEKTGSKSLPALARLALAAI